MIILNEITLRTRSGNRVPSSTIQAAMSSTKEPAARCFDGDNSTSCATGDGDGGPRLVARFPCAGSALATLKAMEVVNTRRAARRACAEEGRACTIVCSGPHVLPGIGGPACR